MKHRKNIITTFLLLGFPILVIFLVMPTAFATSHNIGGPGTGGTINNNGSGFTNPLGDTDLVDIIFKVIKFLLSLAAVLALAAIIVGGIYYIISFGDEKRAETGKKAIQYAIIGLLIISVSFAILTTIYSIL